MIETTMRRNLIRIVDAYAEATGQSRAQISKDYYGRSDFLDQFQSGQQTITIRRLERMLKGLRRKWPKDTPWPYLPAVMMTPPPR
jgi:hypothetical protein